MIGDTASTVLCRVIAFGAFKRVTGSENIRETIGMLTGDVIHEAEPWCDCLPVR